MYRTYLNYEIIEWVLKDFFGFEMPPMDPNYLYNDNEISCRIG
jgi:hypothetical protein